MTKAKAEPLGQRLLRLRKAKFYSQEWLAKCAANSPHATGRSVNALRKSLSLLESDEVQDPGVHTLAAFAEALGVTIEELI